MTVVIDTLTGQVTGEHPSNDFWRLQLSDSAVLDGATAYSLQDGHKLWSFVEEKYGYTGYSGPAGHRCFIAKFERDQNEDRIASARVTLTSDDEERGVSEKSGIALSDFGPVLVNGWAVQYEGPIPADDKGESLHTDEGREAHAVSLDSLLGHGHSEEEPVALGRITDVHHGVSRRSGVIRTSESVFDPATRKVTPVSQYPSLAGAATGIDATIREGKQSGALVIRPGDGSAGLTIPIEPGSVSFPMEGEKPVPLNSSEDPVFLNAPGITLVALDPDREISSRGRKGDYTHTHRLYGVAGGSA